ncbi:esterase/lipase family protein [Natrinema caseinilyticum]|uniref:esterase/lipase family protein n=1 Tax=Natrinema caseinilyticum TaxID=2961570 RepID=UPI0020C43CD5|nr:alpha/beta hydrolase [Natrinema caseinilyticum]
MGIGDKVRGSEREERQSKRPTRRRVLRLASAATGTTIGLAGASGSVSAGNVKDCAHWPDSPKTYPTVDLTQERPEPLGLDEDELCLYVHGWNGRARSDSQTYALEQALRDAGYAERVIAASWASDTLNFWQAESNADAAGVRLGYWLRDVFQSTGETTIRVVGHSLGTRVILETLSELDGDVVLDSVSLLGAAVEDDSVCEDGRFSTGIRTSADEVYSYRSEDDTVVCTIYDFSTVEDGLGCDGADCGGWWDDGSTPDNYHDVDVTSSVPQHCDYFVPDRSIGCIDRVVDDFGTTD